jgi:hypothetical protein
MAKAKSKTVAKRPSAEDRLSEIAVIVGRMRSANASDATVYIVSAEDRAALEELVAE